MKKILLACSLIVGSFFLVYAQNSWDTDPVTPSAPVDQSTSDNQSGQASQPASAGSGFNLKLNVGQVCGKIDGKPACYNPSTGQWQITTGNGVGVSGNTNTGQVTGAGTIGGVRVGGSGLFGSAGTPTGGAGGVNGVSGQQNYTGILGLFNLVQVLVVRAAPLLVGIAMLAFFWFLIEFIWKGRESADEQAKGKKGMMYSIIALFVMVSVWGIIGFMGQVLGINSGGTMSGFKLPGEK